MCEIAIHLMINDRRYRGKDLKNDKHVKLHVSVNKLLFARPFYHYIATKHNHISREPHSRYYQKTFLIFRLHKQFFTGFNAEYKFFSIH